MAFQRAFLKVLLLGVAVSSAAAGRSLQQIGKGKFGGGGALMAGGMYAQPGIAQPALIARQFQPTNLVNGVLPLAQPLYVGQNTGPLVAGPTFIGKNAGAAMMMNAAPGVIAAPLMTSGPVLTGGIQYQYVPQRVITPVYRQQVAPAQAGPPPPPKRMPQFNLQFSGFGTPNMSLGIGKHVLPQIHKIPRVDLPAASVDFPEGKIPDVNMEVSPPTVPKDLTDRLPQLPARLQNMVNQIPNPEVPTFGVETTFGKSKAGWSIKPQEPATEEAGAVQAAASHEEFPPKAPTVTARADVPAELPAKSIKITMPNFGASIQQAADKIKNMIPRRQQRQQPTQVSPEYVEQVVMQPMPVQSVAPVVSSSVTMPPYIAKPKVPAALGAALYGAGLGYGQGAAPVQYVPMQAGYAPAAQGAYAQGAYAQGAYGAGGFGKAGGLHGR